jgi:hypothetical protein
MVLTMLQRNGVKVNRLLVGVAAWVYGLSASHAPSLLMDALAPRAKDVAEADFPCADSPCGCRTAEQCRTACCCGGDGGRIERVLSNAMDSPLFAPVTAIGEDRCAGKRPGDGGGLLLPPHPLPLAGDAFMPVAVGRFETSNPLHPPAGLSRPPDKVPI